MKKKRKKEKERPLTTSLMPLSIRMLHSFMIKLALLFKGEDEGGGVLFSLAPQASLTFSRESRCFDPLGGVGRISMGLGPSESTGT